MFDFVSVERYLDVRRLIKRQILDKKELNLTKQNLPTIRTSLRVCVMHKHGKFKVPIIDTLNLVQQCLFHKHTYVSVKCNSVYTCFRQTM